MQQSLRILWEGFYEIDEGHRCFGEFEQVLIDKVEGDKPCTKWQKSYGASLKPSRKWP